MFALLLSILLSLLIYHICQCRLLLANTTAKKISAQPKTSCLQSFYSSKNVSGFFFVSLIAPKDVDIDFPPLHCRISSDEANAIDDPGIEEFTDFLLHSFLKIWMPLVKVQRNF